MGPRGFFNLNVVVSCLLMGSCTLSIRGASTVTVSENPDGASSLGWVESTPNSSLSVTATWTKSASSNLSNQKIQFFSDGTCTTPSGALINLASASTQSHAFVAPGPGSYSFIVLSYGTSNPAVLSSCSPVMVIDQTFPNAATSIGWTEVSPHHVSLVVNSAWTKSNSTDLANQKIRYYTDASCTTAYAAEVDLASSTVQTHMFIPASGGTYYYLLTSVDTAGNSTASACSSALVIDISPALAWTPLTHAFGNNAYAYAKSPSVPFTFSNTGYGTATGCSAPVMAGTDANQFEISIDGCGTANLAVGNSCTVHVRTAITSLGAKTATLSRTCTVGGTIITTANQITATGIAATPTLMVKDDNNGDIGEATVGYRTANYSVDFINFGNAAATGCTAPTLVSAEYTLVSHNCGASIAVGGFCTAIVRGNPTGTGARPSANLGLSCSTGGSVSLALNMDGNSDGLYDQVSLTHSGMIVRKDNGKASITGLWGGNNAPREFTAVSNVTQVTSGENFGCMLLANGTVECAGYEALGDGVCTPSLGPTVTVSGINTAVQIAGSNMGSHACALLANGSIKCWGENSQGQLGNGSTTASCAPVAVSGITTAVSISAGGNGTCAVLANGQVQCWGDIVGDGLGISSSVPSTVKTDAVTVLSDVASVSVGYSSRCAVLKSGLVKCWGSNDYGNFGNGTKTSAYNYAEAAMTGITNAVQMSISDYSASCARLASGVIMCAGDNTRGQLGDGTLNSSDTPVQVIGLTGVTQVADSGHCAVLSSHTIKCWSGTRGNLTTEYQSPAETKVGIINAAEIATTSTGQCVLHNDNTVSCWGWAGDEGELGPQTSGGWATNPVVIPGINSAIHIAAADHTTCAILVSGTIQCWGRGAEGQRGDNDTSYNLNVTTVSGITDAVTITGGRNYFCARLADGTAKCWGLNDHSQLGDGSTTNALVPVAVAGLSNVISIHASSRGGQHTCAVHINGTVECWGENSAGQLGNNSTTDSATPVTVVGLSGVTSLSLGNEHTCALKSDGTVACWGENGSGQLGNSSTTDSLVPVNVTWFSNVSSITSNNSANCAVLTDGTLRCWGYGNGNIMGVPGYSAPQDPINSVVAGVTLATQSTLSDEHGCVVKSDGSVMCWGWYGTSGNIDTSLTEVSGSIPSGVTPAVKQISTYDWGGGGFDPDLNFSFPTTAGNTIIVYVWSWANATSGVTDSNGNTYTSAISESNGAGHFANIFYAKNIAGGSPTITVGAVGFTHAIAVEVSGLSTASPLDQVICNNDPASVTTMWTDITPMTTSSNEFVAALVVGAGNNTVTWDYDQVNWQHIVTENDNGAHQAGQAIYRIVHATDTYSHTWEATPAGGFSACIATFK